MYLSLRSWILGTTSTMIVIIGFIAAGISLYKFARHGKTVKIFPGIFLLLIFLMWIDSAIDFWMLLILNINIHPYLSQQIDSVVVGIAGVIWMYQFYEIIEENWMKYLPLIYGIIGIVFNIFMLGFPTISFYILPATPGELISSNFTPLTLIFVVIYIVSFAITGIFFLYFGPKFEEKSTRMKCYFLGFGIITFCIGSFFLAVTTGNLIITLFSQIIIMASAVLLFLGFNVPQRWLE
ncbi:MAG: hypothetical protein ACXQS8_07930 [Candidatus Helarchaeales archaeon]